MFDKFDLDVKKIENTKFEYLYPNFMVKNEITMFAAPPSSGKSLVSVALCNMFLSQNKIETIIYFDADDGSATIKERNIHKIKQKFDKRLDIFTKAQHQNRK